MPNWLVSIGDWEVRDWLSEHTRLLAGLVVLVVAVTPFALVWLGIIKWGFAHKSLWDMLEVLGIPLAVALLAGLLALSGREAGQRAELERELQRERAQETILQSYLQRITDLVIAPHNLVGAQSDSAVRAAAGIPSASGARPAVAFTPPPSVP